MLVLAVTSTLVLSVNIAQISRKIFAKPKLLSSIRKSSTRELPPTMADTLMEDSQTK